VSWIGIKWADLASVSTLTQMALFFIGIRGNPMKSSIEIESHFWVRIFESLSSPLDVDANP